MSDDKTYLLAVLKHIQDILLFPGVTVKGNSGDLKAPLIREIERALSEVQS